VKVPELLRQLEVGGLEAVEGALEDERLDPSSSPKRR